MQDPAQDAESQSEGPYRHTRKAFHGLPLEQQARFLVEATASTMARGLEAVARSVADEMEEAFHGPDPTEEEASGAHDAAPATAPEQPDPEDDPGTADASDASNASNTSDDPAIT